MTIHETVKRPSFDTHGHQFEIDTCRCVCGMTMQQLEAMRDKAPSHDDMLLPGTVGKVYRQRSTGREIHYRKRIDP